MIKVNLLNRRLIIFTLFICLSTLLSGCLYPQTDSSPTTVVSKEAMRNVQGAIEQYIDEKGILPIHNSDSSVDRFEKFKVNFEALRSEGYLETLPSSSFEGGGNYYFLVLNEETEPIVKAQSIFVAQKVIDVQRDVDAYKESNGVYPFAEQRYDGFYNIDFAVMNKKAPELLSMYSDSLLELIIDENGIVYINYASDIYQAIKKIGKDNIEGSLEEMDLRELLIVNSDYVPVKSTPYKLINDEPVPLLPYAK